MRNENTLKNGENKRKELKSEDLSSYSWQRVKDSKCPMCCFSVL